MLRRLALVAVVALLGASATSCSSSSGGYPVTVYFPKAVSLYNHSDVKILGLSAGKVNDITVLGDRVRVRMRIDRGVKLPAGVNATIIPLSLIGERYVQLFPPWKEGQPTAPSGTVIPVERTTIPTEPDEALAALKKFLDSLDPNATGRLVKNLSADLNGNGQSLNDALKGISQLTTTLADKDQQLLDIVDHFDRLTTTLRSRESQLGQVMDEFATTTKLLADERRNIETLVHSLARLSTDGLDLVSVHGARLDKDLTQLTRTLQAVSVHLDDLDKILISSPTLVAGNELDGSKGLVKAYDPKYHRIDLRNEASPTVAQAFAALGLPVPGSVVCLPIDVSCTPTAPAATARRPAAAPTAAPTPTAGTTAAVAALGATFGTASAGPATGITQLPVRRFSPEVPARARPAHGPLAWLRRAARALSGALG